MFLILMEDTSFTPYLRIEKRSFVELFQDPLEFFMFIILCLEYLVLQQTVFELHLCGVLK